MNKINPVQLLYKIPVVKRKLEKAGFDPKKDFEETFGDKYSGLSVGYTEGYVVVILFVFIFAIVNILIGLLNLGIVPSMKQFIPMLILAIAIVYFYIHRNDKYIQHFETFEKLPGSQIRKYSWLSFAFMVFVMGLFMLGLRLALPPKTP